MLATLSMAATGSHPPFYYYYYGAVDGVNGSIRFGSAGFRAATRLMPCRACTYLSLGEVEHGDDAGRLVVLGVPRQDQLHLH